MRILYLKRLILWISLLSYTLIKFWIKNPQSTIAILGFIVEKMIASPKFFSRNILIEKHREQFDKFLMKTTKIYKQYGKNFNPLSQISYEKLDAILSDRVQILYFIIRKFKPSVIIETGVAAGNTTGMILQALKDNNHGKLYSLDLPFQWYIYGKNKVHLDSLPPGQISGYLVPTHLKKKWQLILGNTYEKLPILLNKLGKIDIFFHDSEHTDKTMLYEYSTAWPYIRKKGLLISDDISHTKAFGIFKVQKGIEEVIYKDFGIIKK